MDFTLTERLLIGKALISVLEEATSQLDDPYDDSLPEMIKKAVMAQLRMKNFYSKHNEPPEMFEQLEQMDIIIKRLFELQNKKCC
ncbi:MAG TPA: hypothetical protein VLI92_00810 [Candidatus Saccharimonadales bacterium]|nr:hypothetical protein [Candidatus Saccharimonadales bacterium]